MNLEIERKFLVKGHFEPLVTGKFEIAQGYLSSIPERTVRVRIASGKGFLTIKGKSDVSGMERFEWEQSIPVEDARSLLAICEPGVIYKTRYVVEYGHQIIEVDVFEGENQGLILAEVELQSKDEVFIVPDWLGKEVTGDHRYYNSYLSKKPYSGW